MNVKKDFNNAASKFISIAKEKPIDSQPLNTEAEIIYEIKERRSRKLQILLTPSLYEKINKYAKQKNTSINDVINKTLEYQFKKIIS